MNNNTLNLLNTENDKERKRGIKVRSNALLAFLKDRNASANVLHAFEAISFSRQIALPQGILFSEREIFRRNEFVNGDFIVIGVRRDYAFYVINLQTGRVGVIPSFEEGESIPEEMVEYLNVGFAHFVVSRKQENPLPDPTCLVPQYFNVDDVAIMRVLFDCGLARLSKSPRTFRRWLSDAGIPETFCFQKIAPISEVTAGACVIFPYTQIVSVNYERRRRINPRFLVVGSCPDGNLVVLDMRRSALSIGYVAFEEVGDEASWDDYYVHISQTLGSFLHDSNFLGILPDDYYQAKRLGY